MKIATTEARLTPLRTAIVGIVAGLAALAALAAPAAAQNLPAPPTATDAATTVPAANARLGTPPFEAWVHVNAYWPRRSSGHLAAGVMRRGDRVTVLRCTKRCDDKNPVGIVEGGALVPLRVLSKLPMPDAVAASVDFDHFRHGRVRRWRATVHERPDAKSRVIRKERSGYLVAFLPPPAVAEPVGAAVAVTATAKPALWLQRIGGGWMKAADVTMLTASTFQGVNDPKLPMAFTIHTIYPREIKGGSDEETRATMLKRARKRRGKPVDEEAKAALEAMTIPRYSSVGGVRIRRGRLEIPDGRTLPAWKTRIAWPRTRPSRVDVDALWAHVDLDQQTMVIYRGDTPLRATLVSTGKAGTSTRPGLYGVLSKVRLSTMNGRTPEPYLAEGVPFVMHFYQGQALHEAWWHNGFGTKRSHGCINMAPADARWLFDLASPVLPSAWRGVLLSHGDERLTVLIEKKTPHDSRTLRDPAPTDDRRCVEGGRGSKKIDCPFDSFEGNNPGDDAGTDGNDGAVTVPTETAAPDSVAPQPKSPSR